MKLLISDTADVIIRRKDGSGHVFITAESQLGALTAALGVDETIFGGIGNKSLAKIRGQKEISASVRNAFYDKELLSMTQGVEIEDGSATIYKREDSLKVTDNEGILEVAITGTPVDDEAILRNSQGETELAVVNTNVVTVPEGFAEEGEILSVTYKENVTGEIVALDSEKFAEAHTLEMHTIAYNPETNRVVRDIYIQLDHVIPSGDFELSFENGSAIAPEINFEAMVAPNTTEIGRIIEVPRV